MHGRRCTARVNAGRGGGGSGTTAAAAVAQRGNKRRSKRRLARCSSALRLNKTTAAERSKATASSAAPPSKRKRSSAPPSHKMRRNTGLREQIAGRLRRGERVAVIARLLRLREHVGWTVGIKAGCTAAWRWDAEVGAAKGIGKVARACRGRVRGRRAKRGALVESCRGQAQRGGWERAYKHAARTDARMAGHESWAGREQVGGAACASMASAWACFKRAHLDAAAPAGGTRG